MPIIAILMLHLPAPAADPVSAVVLPPPLAPAAATLSHDHHRQWLEDQHRQRLNALLANPDDPARRAQYANWILAEACEPALSRLLLDCPLPEDGQALERYTFEALQQLSQVPESWSAADSSRTRDVEFLTAVGQAMAQFALHHRGAADVERMNSLANDLALWLDDDRQDVARYAALWQSLMYARIGKSELALKVLPLGLEPIDGSRVLFYMQILRCRMHADSGSHTPALTILLKMEERCEQWFTEPQVARQALCTLTWLRYHISGEALSFDLLDWSKSMLVDWRRRAAEILQDADEPCTLLRLSPAVPMLMDDSPPPADPEPDAPPAE